MIPYAIPIQRAVSFFHLPIQVKTIKFTTVDGEMVQALPKTKTILAAVDPGNGQSLENIFGGNVSDGDIAIYTKSVLSIDDQFVPGDTQYQTFIDYHGLNYRVTQRADWTDQVGIYVYLCKRHVKQDNGFV